VLFWLEILKAKIWFIFFFIFICIIFYPASPSNIIVSSFIVVSKLFIELWSHHLFNSDDKMSRYFYLLVIRYLEKELELNEVIQSSVSKYRHKNFDPATLSFLCNFRSKCPAIISGVSVSFVLNGVLFSQQSFDYYRIIFKLNHVGKLFSNSGVLSLLHSLQSMNYTFWFRIVFTGYYIVLHVELASNYLNFVCYFVIVDDDHIPFLFFLPADPIWIRFQVKYCSKKEACRTYNILIIQGSNGFHIYFILPFVVCLNTFCMVIYLTNRAIIITSSDLLFGYILFTSTIAGSIAIFVCCSFDKLHHMAATFAYFFTCVGIKIFNFLVNYIILNWICCICNAFYLIRLFVLIKITFVFNFIVVIYVDAQDNGIILLIILSEGPNNHYPFIRWIIKELWALIQIAVRIDLYLS